MTAETREKVERVHCRVTTQNKAILKKAAALTGQDLTSFVTDATVERAIEVIEKHERLSLSERDSMIFIEAIDNPPAPSQKLREAASKYKKKHVIESEDSLTS